MEYKLLKQIALFFESDSGHYLRSNSTRVLSSTTTICILVYLSAKSNKRFSRLLKITLQIITVAHTITTASSDQMFTHWPTTLNKFSISHLQSSKFCYCFEFRTSWLCAVETHACCLHGRCGVCLIDRNNYIILSWKIIDMNLKWPNKTWILSGFYRDFKEQKFLWIIY